jgi:lysophospholipase L1-like esterase
MKRIVYIFIGLFILYHFHTIASAAPKIRNINPKGKNIICFGDSITAGYGAKGNMNYPAQLSRIISRPVINAGRIGDTTSSALRRLKKDVLSRSPKIVIITLGGNDLKNGIPKEIAFRNLRYIVKAIQNQGALVIIGGISFPGIDRGYGRSYVALAAETRALLIPNILANIVNNKNLMHDRIHPNKRGYYLIARRFYSVIKPFV